MPSDPLLPSKSSLLKVSQPSRAVPLARAECSNPKAYRELTTCILGIQTRVQIALFVSLILTSIIYKGGWYIADT